MGVNMTAGERLLYGVRAQMQKHGAEDAPSVARVVVGGEEFFLRSLSAERWAALLVFRRRNRDDTFGMYARLLIASVVGPDDEPVYTDADIPAVGNWPALKLEAVAQAVLRHNHIPV